MNEGESLVCSKCGKKMDASNFYAYRDGRKTEMCKKCLTMHVNAFDESTFLWLLEKLDFPYSPKEWNTLRDRAFAKNPKVNGTSVFGRYLSKMKLKQWLGKGWADTAAVQAEEIQKTEEQIKADEEQEAWAKEAYERGDMSEAQYRTLVSTTTQHKEAVAAAQASLTGIPATPQFFDEAKLPDYTQELTDDDKIYLAMKWGRYYQPAEWIQLEKDYNRMLESFPDATDADSLNTLILICKTNLKMNQAIDGNDLEGYQKLSRTYDQMRKSSKFTAAQNKKEKEAFVDSVGKLVYYCEKWGGQIPKFEITADNDIVDTVIKDNQNYLKNLVYNDTALAQQIEDYIKRERIAMTSQIDKLTAKLKGKDPELSDDDIADYYEEIAAMQAEDEKTQHQVEAPEAEEESEE